MLDILDKILELLENKDFPQLGNLLKDMNPADVAELFEDLPREKIQHGIFAHAVLTRLHGAFAAKHGDLYGTVLPRAGALHCLRKRQYARKALRHGGIGKRAV